jgi:hypothetical protein
MIGWRIMTFESIMSEVYPTSHLDGSSHRAPLETKIDNKPQIINKLMKNTVKRLENLISSLSSKGYSVHVKDIKELPWNDVDCLVSVSMTYGPNRRDCKGGYILTREDGSIQYDFFVGGCKHGTHLDSYLNRFHDGFVGNLPVARILNFLSPRVAKD